MYKRFLVMLLLLLSLHFTGCAKEYPYPSGKDSILMFGDGRISISKFADEKCLMMYLNIDSYESLLREVERYQLKKETLYVVSKEGYGVVDKNYFVRLYVTVPDEEFVSGYSEDEEGNRTYFSRFLEVENVQYLNSFYEFSESEQKILNSMRIDHS